MIFSSPEMSDSCWLWPLAPWLLLIICIACLIIFSISCSSKLPPGPPALPIIGHLHLLADFSHLTLAHFSTKYGPIFFLRLGSMPAVFVSTSKLAKEFLQTHDKTFADRPPMEVVQRAAYGRDHSVVFAPYGARWKELRSLCTVELFSAKRLSKLQYIRTEELRLMLRGIQEQSQGGKLAIDVGECLGAWTSDVVGRMVLSDRISCRRVKGGSSLKQLIRRWSALLATPVIGDFIPYLGWLDVKIKRATDEIHCLLDELLEEVVSEKQQEKDGNTPASDMFDVLLSTTITSSGEARDKTTAKGIVLDLLAAGVDTSSNTVEWAMAELLKNPRCLKKLKHELETAVQGRPSGDMLEESETSNLPYLSSVIKETFRLHPPAPLLIPHASTEACTVAGYTLPKHTRLFVNVWAIGRDPQIWENPLQFWPERFQDKDIDVRGQHFELLPFGSGRRSCPGMALGLAMVACTLANLVHRFDWELPGGMSAMELDMQEENGVTVCRATPLLGVPKMPNTTP